MPKTPEPRETFGPKERQDQRYSQVGQNAPSRVPAQEQSSARFKHYPDSGNPIYHRLWHYKSRGEPAVDLSGLRPCKTCRPDLD